MIFDGLDAFSKIAVGDNYLNSKYWPQKQCEIGNDGTTKSNASESVLDFVQQNFQDKGYGFLPMNPLIDNTDRDYEVTQSCKYMGWRLNSYNDGFSFDDLLSGMNPPSGDS